MLVTVQCTMRSQRPVAAKMAAAVRMMGNCMIFPLRLVEIRGGEEEFVLVFSLGDDVRSSCRFSKWEV